MHNAHILRTWITPLLSALEAGTRQLTTNSSSAKRTRPVPCAPKASAISKMMPTPHLLSTDEAADGSGDLRNSRFPLRHASSLENQVEHEGDVRRTTNTIMLEGRETIRTPKTNTAPRNLSSN